MVVLLVVILIGFGVSYWFGELVILVDKGVQLIVDFDFLSWVLLYVVVVGFYFFLFGLISGYFDNKVVYVDIGKCIGYFLWLCWLFGSEWVGWFGSYIQDWLGGIMGNFLFGCMFGLIGVIGIIFGLLFDIWYIVFLLVNFGYVMIGFQFVMLVKVFLWVVLGIVVIGFINLVVSFWLVLCIVFGVWCIQFEYWGLVFLVIWLCFW